jgi:hypothetical protein
MSFTPRVGKIVLFKTRLASLKFNQATQEIASHPAIITKVHNENFVDVTVFFNGSMPAPKNGVFNVDTQSSWWEPREE